MANFEVQYRAGSEIKTAVVSASDQAAAGKAFRSTHHSVSVDDIRSVKNIDYYRKYAAATFISALISFAGWIVLVMGVVGVIVGLLSAQRLVAHTQADAAQQVFLAMSLGGAYISFVIAIMGLLMVAVGQHLRATTDAANSLGEILATMKKGVATALPQSTMQVPQQVPAGRSCSSCGAIITDAGSTFCVQCGAKL